MQVKIQKTIKVNHKQKLSRKNIATVLRELKEELRHIYGTRFLWLILYGSYARNEAWEESDIDVVVVVEGEVSPAKEIDRMLDVITDLDLKYNVLLSVYPVSQKSLQTINSPLLLNIKKEGVSV